MLCNLAIASLASPARYTNPRIPSWRSPSCKPSQQRSRMSCGTVSQTTCTTPTWRDGLATVVEPTDGQCALLCRTSVSSLRAARRRSKGQVLSDAVRAALNAR